MTSPAQRPPAMVRPLRQCVLRCDQGLRTIEGGTYGFTRNGGTKFHGGVDLYAELGTPCFAIYCGAVEWTRDFGAHGWGKALLTRVEFPGWTCWALYAHLSDVLVKRGRLEPGVILGRTGATGNADSKYPHLHFETWRSTNAGLAGTAGKYRFDPLHLLGTLPYQPFATELLARGQYRGRTA